MTGDRDVADTYPLVSLLQLAIVVGTNTLLLPSIGQVASALTLVAKDAVGFAGVGVLIWRGLAPAGTKGRVV
jgi:hypothetical protein